VLPGRGNRFYQKARPAAPGQVERLVQGSRFAAVVIVADLSGGVIGFCVGERLAECF